MAVFTTLLLFGLLRPDVVPGGLGERLSSKIGAQQRAVDIRLHYYLNDRERRAADECRFDIVVDAEVVPLVSRKGDAWSFVPRTGRQTVVLKCGGYLVITSLEFDLFDGGAIVFGVVTDLGRLDDEWTPKMPVLAGDHNNVFGYHETRASLRRRWLGLPPVIRSQVKSGYAVVFRPSSGPNLRKQCFAAGFR